MIERWLKCLRVRVTEGTRLVFNYTRIFREKQDFTKSIIVIHVDWNCKAQTPFSREHLIFIFILVDRNYVLPEKD